MQKSNETQNNGQNVGVDFSRENKPLVDQQKPPTRVALICPDLLNKYQKRSKEIRLEEFIGLAGAIRLEIIFSEIVKVREIKPATFIGGGYVDELTLKIKENDIDLVLVDASLSPIQQRNLETRLEAKVLDRTALILEIFGERAATREGVLQVELAHLNYQKGRLVRSWTHLERQRGGGAFTGGPGETQIESDRRQIQERIIKLERELEKVAKTRKLQRAPRDAVPFPIVALVGYTNSGKSTLFNRITNSKVKAQNLLFATLDTTVRKAKLPHGREIMLSDTVGFIADLPTDLIAAFRATLEEVTKADIILHVRDIASDDHIAQAQDVMAVLNDLGVDAIETPIIEVWNKIDLIKNSSEIENISTLGQVEINVEISAVTGQGVENLLEEIEAVLAQSSNIFDIIVPHEKSEDIGWLYAHGEVLERCEPDEKGTKFTVRITPRYSDIFQTRFENQLSVA